MKISYYEINLDETPSAPLHCINLHSSYKSIKGKENLITLKKSSTSVHWLDVNTTSFKASVRLLAKRREEGSLTDSAGSNFESNGVFRKIAVNVLGGIVINVSDVPDGDVILLPL